MSQKEKKWKEKMGRKVKKKIPRKAANGPGERS